MNICFKNKDTIKNLSEKEKRVTSTLKEVLKDISIRMEEEYTK